MENEQMRQALREAERGESASWVDYPPTPAWWPPLFGVWAFAVTLNFGYLDGIAGALASLVAVGCMLGLIAWQRRVRGTYPSGRAPREFRTSFIVLFGGALVVSLAAWLVGTTVAPWVGAVVAGLGSGVLVAWYERSYARAAARVRARLG